MASDEIKLMLFAGELSTQDNLKHLHPELVAQIVKQVWPVAYTQGRADAWRWREYPEEKPEVDGKFVAIFSGVPNHWYELFYDCALRIWLDGQGGKDLNITHWLPITLPTEAK